MHRFFAAHSFEGGFLHRSQQLGLDLRRQVAHLVQEERASSGKLESSPALAHGARERSFLVAEELALRKPGGEHGAVERHERRVRAWTEPMDGPGNLFFARAGLTGYQDGKHGAGHDPC